MTRIQLPDDAWAELYAPRKVKERQRRTYILAMSAMSASTQALPRLPDGTTDPSGFGPEQQSLADAAFDALTVCLVEAWSYQMPITAESLLDLPGDAFDTLRKACMELGPELAPDYGVSPDPKASLSVSPGSGTG